MLDAAGFIGSDPEEQEEQPPIEVIPRRRERKQEEDVPAGRSNKQRKKHLKFIGGTDAPAQQLPDVCVDAKEATHKIQTRNKKKKKRPKDEEVKIERRGSSSPSYNF